MIPRKRGAYVRGDVSSRCRALRPPLFNGVLQALPLMECGERCLVALAEPSDLQCAQAMHNS